jgi:iron complex transport system substrate-binding protein
VRYPERIVCLTEETTETLYLLEEDWRIVGISGFTVRPPEARRDKPRVSAFTSAKIGKILALAPDLALGFSDLQAQIAAELVRAGIEVHVFNQRTVADIFRMMLALGGMIGCSDKAERLVVRLSAGVEAMRAAGDALARRPRVYFEEWDEPQISCIAWVSELIGIAGGENCFPELAVEPLGKKRIIADPGEVVRRRPDIVIGSWCGKKFRPEKVRARSGLADVPAVRYGELHEIKSSIILQPGPAALTDGLAALHRLMYGWANRHSTPRAMTVQ